jgi:hypothetical protein
MGFLRAIFWEQIQNLPLILFFILTVWLWARRHRRAALVCAIAGSILSALGIRFILPSIHGYSETIQVTLVNMVSLSVLMLVFAAYLGSDAGWSNRKTDVLLGGLAGVCLGVAQGLASAGDPWFGVALHSLALSLAAPVVLISTRTLKDRTLSASLAGGLLISAMMTIVISLLDYSYFLLGLE